MGLDQFAYALDTRPEAQVDFALPELSEEAWSRIYAAMGTKDADMVESREGRAVGRVAIAYWRKHPNLHGFIQQIYERKGGEHFQLDSFVGPVLLDLEDIDAIEAATRAWTLPHTEGFFFGVSGPDKDAITLAFCERARQEIAAGKSIAYDSCW